MEARNPSVNPPVTGAVLHAILDVDISTRAGWRVADLARALIDGGAMILQIRAKSMPSGPLLLVSDMVVAIAEAHRTTVIVNDRADVARMSGAAGVHLGQEDLSPALARAILGADAVVGLSTHTVEQVESAATESVSYIAIGPVFTTSTKATGYEAVGLDMVKKAVRLARGRPVVGIGGITLENARSVIDAGASGVAVIGDLLMTGDPAARVAAYRRALG